MDKVASRVHHHHHQHQHFHQHPHNHHHNHSHHHSHYPPHQSHHYPHHAHYQHHDHCVISQEPAQSLETNQNYDDQNLAQVAHLGNQLAAQSKRKEKARIAARARRSQEAQIIMEMANELHISQEKIRRIDKATIVKLAIDYIKAFEILCRFCSTCCQPITAISPPVSNTKKTIKTTTKTTTIPETTTTTTTTTRTTSTTAVGKLEQEDSSKRNKTSCITKIRLNESNDAESRASETRPAPKLSTGLIFAPKTDDMDSHFLMIREGDEGAAFVLKPDSEILDDDDLTHLAPQAGDTSISLEVEPLEGIVLDTDLFVASLPKCAVGRQLSLEEDACCGSIGTAKTNFEATTATV